MNPTAIKKSKYFHYLDNLLKGNRQTCKDIISDEIMGGTDIKVIYEKYIQSSLYAVGKMWEKGKMDIATEHLASCITEDILANIVELVRPTLRNGKTIIVSCISKEFHHLGAKIVSDIFEINGWNSYFLGANTPSNALISFTKELNPNTIGLSSSFYVNIIRLFDTLDQLHKSFPKIDIIVGGQIVERDHENILEKFPFVKCIKTLQELEDYAKRH